MLILSESARHFDQYCCRLMNGMATIVLDLYFGLGFIFDVLTGVLVEGFVSSRLLDLRKIL